MAKGAVPKMKKSTYPPSRSKAPTATSYGPKPKAYVPSSGAGSTKNVRGLKSPRAKTVD